MNKCKRHGNPSRFLFLLLLHVCVHMFLILLVSGSLLLLMPFLSFLAFCSPPLSTLWWLLFYLVLVIHHIKDKLLPSELFLPGKISHSSCQLPFLYFSPVRSYLELFLEVFSEGHKFIIFHVLVCFFNFERGLTWHYITLRKRTRENK